MKRILIGLGFALASCQTVTTIAPNTIVVSPNTLPAIARVDPRFQSYNVEMAEVIGGRFWAPYPNEEPTVEAKASDQPGSLGFEAALFRQREPADLTNPRLRSLAKALGPAYIRVSGSWANKTFFQDNNLPRLTTPPSGFENVLTRDQWRGVVDFAKAVDGRITISFAVSDGARDSSGIWSPVEARKLLRFTRSIGGAIHSAELINEPNLGAISGLPAGYNADTFAHDIATFRNFVEHEAPELKTVGPGSTGETGVALFNNRGLSTEDMLSAQPPAQFDYFSYHFYGGRSQRCARMAPASAILPEDALSEEWLGRTDTAFAFYKDLRDRHMPGAPIWLNETAQASCGGDKWAASFLDSFRYVDQMGRLAKQGVSVIMHNTLAASDYGLINEETLKPRPNYWTALLWRRLMGEVVLDAGPLMSGLHIYAHCLRGQQGGVAIAAINFDQTGTASLKIPFPAVRYTLKADHIQSETVKLNGTELALAGDTLPEIHGEEIKAGSIILPSVSITFLAVPAASNRGC